MIRRGEPGRPAVGGAPGGHCALLVTDIDGTLILAGTEQPGLGELCAVLAARGDRLVFAIATGRSDAQARRVLAAHGVPAPDVVISSVGTAIAFSGAGAGAGAVIDRGWEASLARGWDAEEARAIGAGVPGLTLQSAEHQHTFKVSFDIDPARFERRALDAALAGARAAIHAIASHGAQLDLLPRAASKGRAVRHLRRALGIPRARTLAAGDSGNDEDMLADAGLGVIVADHGAELGRLRGRRGVRFSAASGAAAILEGLGQLRSGVG